MNFDDLYNLLCAEVLENIYFYQKDKNTKLDTYVFQIIWNGLQKIRNISKTLDSKGWRRERRKDIVFIKKIQKAKYTLEKEGKEYNLDNVWEEIKKENDKIKYDNDKIKYEYFVKLFNSMWGEYLSLDDVKEDDEGSEINNNMLFASAWEETWKDSMYDPYGNYKRKETQELIRKEFDNILEEDEENKIKMKNGINTILKTEAEKLVLEFLLENISDENKNLKIGETEFNYFYKDKLWFFGLNQTQINNVLKTVIKKIKMNKNEFKEFLGVSL